MPLEFCDDLSAACKPITWIWHKGNNPIGHHPIAIIDVDLQDVQCNQLAWWPNILLTVLASRNVLLLATNWRAPAKLMLKCRRWRGSDDGWKERRALAGQKTPNSATRWTHVGLFLYTTSMHVPELLLFLVQSRMGDYLELTPILCVQKTSKISPNIDPIWIQKTLVGTELLSNAYRGRRFPTFLFFVFLFFSHNLIAIFNKPTSELVILLSPSLDLTKTNGVSLCRSNLPPPFFYVCGIERDFIHLSRHFRALNCHPPHIFRSLVLISYSPSPLWTLVYKKSLTETA